MVDHLNVFYLYKKRGVFYFSKRVPCDVKSYYRSDRIVICLKTKSNVSAIRASKSLYQKLMVRLKSSPILYLCIVSYHNQAIA